MKKLTLIATVALIAGPALADMSFDPEDYDSGAYLLDAEEGNSWTQRIWVNISNLGVSGFWQKVTYQFRLCTNPGDPYGNQRFERPENPEDTDGFKLKGYGQSDYTVWNVEYGPHKGVDDAKMWAWGGPTGAGSGDFVWLTFDVGNVDTYMKDEWWEVPEFVLQMQAYGYKSGQPIQRVLNVEFHCKGAGALGDGTGRLGGFYDIWDDGATGGDHTSQPRPALASGATLLAGNDWACGEWTLNAPLPAPGAAVLGGIGLAMVGWVRRQRTA